MHVLYEKSIYCDVRFVGSTKASTLYITVGGEGFVYFQLKIETVSGQIVMKIFIHQIFKLKHVIDFYETTSI